jgi:hypothetical protein
VVEEQNPHKKTGGNYSRKALRVVKKTVYMHLKYLKQQTAFESRAMETRDHSNGAILKSHTSRKNKLTSEKEQTIN